MRTFLAWIFLCSVAWAVPADIPVALREKNYGSVGSCAHASTITALRYVGMDRTATWWRSTYSGGETVYGTESKLTAAGIPFAFTDRGNIALLDYAGRNRLPVIMYHVPAGHAVNLVDFNKESVVILDNNYPQTLQCTPRTDFIRQWTAAERPGFNPGWAIVVIRTPPPPFPSK